MPTQLKIFDIHGREVTTLINEVLEPKYHQIIFDASSLPSGIYFYRLRIGEAAQTKKLVLLR
ncbi:MAG: T9SS type A sorting domain-containing protein [candidate division KSB1 bacterium]|nr:T9SS type A sorting domain-containing protein [candidate division KSB1 bacterium]MDZ7302773.1 T9SS type A sorting domain-containing protein [candidate division KSB1 bacterium]MDZ7310062.1 T9SS type A sorting domain-containing protein [candidate division KSB1 bacterium]